MYLKNRLAALLIGFLLAIFYTSSFAAQNSPVTPHFVDVDKKAYPMMSTGMAVFERFQQLSPNAELKFRLYSRQTSTNNNTIKLWLRTAAGQTPIALSPNLTFTLPKNITGADKAELLSNQPAESLVWYASILSPNQPNAARRLGDLRLECLVNLALNGRPVDQLQQNCQATPEVTCLDIWMTCMTSVVVGAVRDIVVPLSEVSDPYEQGRFRSVFIAERPLFGLTLSQGAKSMTLPTTFLYADATSASMSSDPFYKKPALMGHFYELPLSSPQWQDDALVWFEYMDNL